MTSETLFENLSDVLLRPPAHTWDGPQPGLHAQADETCRYYFSEKSGRLESIVQYNLAGAPDIRVRYRTNSSAEGLAERPRAFEVERWNGASFVSEGIVEQDGRVIRTHSLPRIMITDNGEETSIPVEEQGVFITAAGEVVRLTSEGTWRTRPHAAYLGRVKKFNPLQPFVIKTHAGEQDLLVDRRDVVIDPHGFVFEFTVNGLAAIGELVIPELTSAPKESAQEMCVAHDLFTLHLDPEEKKPEQAVRIDVHDGYAHEFLNGPPPMIVGRHPFVHTAVPELVDVHGGLVAEQNLRAVERAALELGLVFYALRNEKRSQVRATFLKAQHCLEDRLWNVIDILERSVGMDRHTLINPTEIRSWIDFASTSPHEALLELKERAQPKYATR